MSRKRIEHPQPSKQLLFFIEKAAHFEEYSSYINEYGSYSLKYGSYINEYDSYSLKYGSYINEYNPYSLMYGFYINEYDPYSSMYGSYINEYDSYSSMYGSNFKEYGPHSYEYGSYFNEFDPFFLHDTAFCNGYQSTRPEQEFSPERDHVMDRLRQWVTDLKNYISIGEAAEEEVQTVFFHPPPCCHHTGAFIHAPCIITYRIRDGTPDATPFFSWCRPVDLNVMMHSQRLFHADEKPRPARQRSKRVKETGVSGGRRRIG